MITEEEKFVWTQEKWNKWMNDLRIFMDQFHGCITCRNRNKCTNPKRNALYENCLEYISELEQ